MRNCFQKLSTGQLTDTLSSFTMPTAPLSSKEVISKTLISALIDSLIAENPELDFMLRHGRSPLE